ncbi:MAG TPA: DNA double-strand break repair nuclease NurA [archaeon]|nr:DNA double-strand break repair nuclease NurA [archaeon]
MDISRVINEAVSFINSGEEKKKGVAERLAPLKKESFHSASAEIPEKSLVFPVHKWVPEGLVAGVDSGFVAKRLASLDIVLIRAVGVVFNYSDGKVVEAKYYPGFFRFPEPHLSNGALEEDEAQQSKSLMRLREEVNTAKKVIELHSPKYCFIDGSIVPQFQDKPRKDSNIAKDYSGIIKEFESLYSFAEGKNCTLIATVEDSRGSRFRQIMQEVVLPKNGAVGAEQLDGFFDSAFLDYFLAEGERTFAFTYTKNIKQHPVLQDFSKEWGNKIHGFYLKPSALDRPLRVEFISKGNLKEKADEIASVVYALSSLHREYAYPSVLIEADFHAKLKPNEIDIVFSKIMDKLGNSLKLRMRRDNRPF